jgi:hypothetical protein
MVSVKAVLCATRCSRNLRFTVVRGNRPAPGLGGSPLQHEEPAVLLPLGDQRLAMGAAGGDRPGEAQELHGRKPQLQGRRTRSVRALRRQDPGGTLARQASRQQTPGQLAGTQDHSLPQ